MTGAWYFTYYGTTKDGEERLRAALADPDNGASNRADIEKRLSEMKAVPEERCAITRAQATFLERMLAESSNA